LLHRKGVRKKAFCRIEEVDNFVFLAKKKEINFLNPKLQKSVDAEKLLKLSLIDQEVVNQKFRFRRAVVVIQYC
jgi:hypothetical protein